MIVDIQKVLELYESQAGIGRKFFPHPAIRELREFAQWPSFAHRSSVEADAHNCAVLILLLKNPPTARAGNPSASEKCADVCVQTIFSNDLLSWNAIAPLLNDLFRCDRGALLDLVNRAGYLNAEAIWLLRVLIVFSKEKLLDRELLDLFLRQEFAYLSFVDQCVMSLKEVGAFKGAAEILKKLLLSPRSRYSLYRMDIQILDQVSLEAVVRLIVAVKNEGDERAFNELLTNIILLLENGQMSLERLEGLSAAYLEEAGRQIVFLLRLFHSPTPFANLPAQDGEDVLPPYNEGDAPPPYTA